MPADPHVAKAIKLGRVLRVHQLRRAYLRFGVAAAVEHLSALDGRAYDYVADVGANRGQFSVLCRWLFPDAYIQAFEPLASAASTYESLFGPDALAQLSRCALGSRRHQATLHVMARSDSSSLMPLAAKGPRPFRGVTEVRQEKIAVSTLLAEIADERLRGAALLKMDVQGYELEVLKGAVSLLPRFTTIISEVNFRGMYAGQPMASDIICFLLTHGFHLTGVYDVHWRDGEPVQADMIFDRAEASGKEYS